MASARLEAGSAIPHGGGAAAIIIGAIFVAVTVGIVAIELRRNPLLWTLTSFIAAFILISAIHAALT